MAGWKETSGKNIDMTVSCRYYLGQLYFSTEVLVHISLKIKAEFMPNMIFSTDI